MVRCMIIDDEKAAIDVLVNYVSKIEHLELIATATNPITGIDLINRHKPDLVFLDIQMEEMSGIDILKIVGNHTRVIFCTAYSDFALDAFDYEAVDYLMKPIAFPRFMKAVQRAMGIIMAGKVAVVDTIPNDYIFVKTEQRGKLVKINYDEIDFIEGQKNYVAFHKGKEKILTLLNLKDIEDRLPKNIFVRVHRSFIVPFKNIVSIENNILKLRNRVEQVPIGDIYKDQLVSRTRDSTMK
ncbi:LytTR family DNA-binding domain-containing protein [Flavihumibacter sp. RY-1]|uniref:LytTR family DNA-binding domain-containing protein n=1 Tax=Flavihumibacter fluminis TaxID=2909236 RepID=A0ABS9BER7_9BACT|nr:LytTR family DNA-binding domain-containing protein [Flavihumibacter fluminis]MCF1713614.1 LytTR family DNA-binding domain-containing protein [Flavihumibacter fluminis]